MNRPTTQNPLEAKGYIILKNALPPDVCKLFSDYILFKASLQPNVKNDKLKNVHREYGDTLMELYLEKLTPLIEKATERALWPTHSFYYLYKQGTRLEPHTDRSSCQVVAGLCIDASPTFKKNQASWPLILDIQGKAEPISLDFGDLVIFKGFTTKHWRETLTEGWFMSAIFAYVEKDGAYNFQKFDQRQALGKPHIGMFNWIFGCLKRGFWPK